MAMRNILLEDISPAWSLLRNLTLVAFVMMGLGWMVFRVMKRHFYDYL
jgi:ABC-type polysaccharide/polyol phosphate export permease